MPLLIVRPQPGADRTAATARALGLDPIVAPLFVVRALNWVAPNATDYDAILATSANIFRPGRGALVGFRSLPVHAVGAFTAQAARAAGFVVASTGDRSAEELLRSIAPDTRLLRLAGRDHIPLAREGMTTLITYAADAQPMPTDIAAKLHGGAVAAMHSPRAARALHSELDRLEVALDAVAIAALSQAVADAAGVGWRSLAIASQPTDAALLSVAESLCKTGADNDHLPLSGDGRTKA